MKVAPNTVVSIEYVLRVEGEGIVDSTPEGEKVLLLYGEGHVLPPGLEDSLAGRETGSFRIALADGAGAYDPKKVFAAKREDFPDDAKVKVGDEFYFEDDNGEPVTARIIFADGDDVTLDANLELAGKTLEYEGIIHDVREATEEEIKHGHVHGEGGVEH